MAKWDELEQWMKNQQLPRGFEALKDTGWVERYVKSMMASAMPDKPGMPVSTGPETFETHHFIVLKWPLPQGVHPSMLRLYVREDKIRIEGLPNGKREVVSLPRHVYPRVCKALCRDGVLQVKVRKKPVNRQYVEVPIRW